MVTSAGVEQNFVTFKENLLLCRKKRAYTTYWLVLLQHYMSNITKADQQISKRRVSCAHNNFKLTVEMVKTGCVPILIKDIFSNLSNMYDRTLCGNKNRELFLQKVPSQTLDRALSMHLIEYQSKTIYLRVSQNNVMW